MRKIISIAQLEEFGRVRLSQHFFMRNFMNSEIGNIYGIANIPRNPDRAIRAGKKLCTKLLDPLVNTFGPIHIRSAYRSERVNDKGNKAGHNCACNEANYAGHIWDRLDDAGKMGATACIVVPWFADQYANGRDWRDLAWWLHDHLNHSGICFHPKMAAFNLSWHEVPKPRISSYIVPKGLLLSEKGFPQNELSERQKRYSGFPKFCGIHYPTSQTDGAPNAK